MQNSTLAAPTADQSALSRLADHLDAALSTLRDAADSDTHGWRVFRDGKDIGIAFSLEGASTAVQRLRRAHWHPRSMPSFNYRPAGVRGSVPFEKCVVGQ